MESIWNTGGDRQDLLLLAPLLLLHTEDEIEVPQLEETEVLELGETEVLLLEETKEL